MQKRGISGVITSVLIILLVLASVAIIWVFLGPAITKSVGQVVPDCLTLNLEPVSCVYDSLDAPIVQVKRNAGAGSIKELVFVFTFSDGDTQLLNSSNVLNELETKTYELAPLGLGATPVSVKVSSKIALESGDDKICDAGNEVNCVEA